MIFRAKSVAVDGTYRRNQVVKTPHNPMVRSTNRAARVLFAIAAAPIFLVACNRQNLVAKATASATYHQQSYLWKCVDVKGPDACHPCQLAVNDAAKYIPLANNVYKIGPLPKQEVAELNDLIKRLEECP